jgi:hypothetical protein
MNPQDILNNIDINKVNLLTEKKRRGRPLKNLIDNKTLPLQNKTNENDEIVICLKISDQDIKNYQENGLSVKELNEEIESINNEISESIDDNIKTIKYYRCMIKKLGEENKKLSDKNLELETYISKITPMYYTETEFYPNYININDTDGKKIIPKKTKTCCLNCGYSISNLPVYLINYYYDNIFIKMGDENNILFCSFNCANSYNIKLNDENIMKRYGLLVKLYYEINKKNINSITDIIINEAGPIEILEKYGGTMTIDDYRTNFKILGKEYQTMLPPFISSPQYVKATTISKSDTNWIINNNPNSTKNMLKKKATRIVPDKKADSFDNFDCK